MNKIFIFLSILSALVGLSGCKEETPIDKVLFCNMSEERVYIFGYDYDNGDRLTPEKVFFEFGCKLYWFDPNAVGRTAINISEEDAGTSKRYQILLFKESTIKNYTKEELAENNIYDALLIATYEELKANRYTITYTGEEGHKDKCEYGRQKRNNCRD